MPGPMFINPDDRDGQVTTPIALACDAGDPAQLRAYLDLGFDPNEWCRDRGGRKSVLPIYLAVQAPGGRAADTLRALLQHPSCVGAVDLEKGHAEGNTPLSAASHIGDPEVIGILLAAGAQVDAPRADTYYPPLTTAMALGHRDAVRRLLEGGAGTCLVAMALDRRQSARQCTATATLHATTTLARPWPTDARADPNYVHKKQRVKLSAVHECCGSSLDLHTNLLLLMDLLNTTRVTASTMRSVVTCSRPNILAAPL